MRRRDFLYQAAAGALAARNLQASWEAGSVAHILATANHERILLKASFQAPLVRAPNLRVGKRLFPGTKTDTAGSFWQFDAPGLEPGRPHELQLLDAARKALC